MRNNLSAAICLIFPGEGGGAFTNVGNWMAVLLHMLSGMLDAFLSSSFHPLTLESKETRGVSRAEVRKSYIDIL